MTSIDPEAFEYIPDHAASTYRKIAAAYGDPYYRSVVEGITPGLDATDRILDAGTGPGFVPVRLAEQVDGIRIDAFDYSRALVSDGRRLAGERGVDDRVSFFVADCYTIPVRDRSYQALISTGVLHALDRPVEALNEFHRVLEPGGIAYVFDPTIFELPRDPNLDLTEHEREVFDSYGLRSEEEERPISTGEAIRLGAASAFSEIRLDVGDPGDLRLSLTRSS